VFFPIERELHYEADTKVLVLTIHGPVLSRAALKKVKSRRAVTVPRRGIRLSVVYAWTTNEWKQLYEGDIKRVTLRGLLNVQSINPITLTRIAESWGR
jgi:hypothetical protein